MIKLKTDAEMIQMGHHWLYLHAKALQDELRTQQAGVATLTAAAELAFTELEEQMDPMDYDDGPPASVCAAYDALFKALGKAPAPETNDDGNDLPP